jgi:formylglycine-generating enzyme required for sulfatase activity
VVVAIVFGLLLAAGIVSQAVRTSYRAEPGAGRKASTAAPSIITTKSGIEMVLVPGGVFEMGSASGAADEAPVHKVTISPFLMDRYEVTQEQFAKAELPDPSHFKDPRSPADQVNWSDAARFCNERSRAEGLQPCYDEKTWRCDFTASGYRLPTEAEWEYACRAGSASRYSFGDADARDWERASGALGDYAWFSENSSKKTHPVGRKRPNAWGLYDMHGNVAEWCNDLFDKEYYKGSPDRDPRGPEKGGRERVVRGGAWNSSADSCRSAYRAGDPSLNDTCLASDALGFRCVRKAAEGSK